LTARLATRCERLVSTDISPRALEQAQQRCANLGNIDFRLVSSAGESFDGDFDLIVLSEVVYYWDDVDTEVVADKLNRSLRPGGRLLMVHWLGETDYPKSGDEAVEDLAAKLDGSYLVERADRTAQYRLDLWRKGLRQ
jgi:SAM-dependent methyltransferase